MGNYAQIVGLYIPFESVNNGVPAVINDLKVTPGLQGALQATLSWTNPAKNHGGESLSELTKVDVYRGETLVKSFSNPVVGEAATWTDEQVPSSGQVSYKLIAVNSLGESKSEPAVVFVGRDVPKAPTNVVLSGVDDKTAKITWEAPTQGVNGGWIDAAALTYRVTRFPGGIVLNENVKATEYVDNNITGLNMYSYKVQANTPDGDGEAALSNKLRMGGALTVPYTCSFATDEEFELWTAVDSNEDGFTWRRETTLDAAYYYYNEDGETPGDDWLISPPIHLEAGKHYRLTCKFQCYGEDVPERVKVFFGTGNTPEGQTSLLGDFVVATDQFESHEFLLPADQPTGDYSVAFYTYSDANSFILYVSGVEIAEVREGAVAGVVTDGQDPLEGVLVYADGTGHKTYTDKQGSYLLNGILGGTYTLGFTKTGYQDLKKESVKIISEQTTTLNVEMTSLPAYAVQGQVLNALNKPVGEAKITLNGYARFQTKTQADGSFVLPKVYQADGYELVVSRYGLCNDTLTVDVKDKAVTLSDVVLADKLLPPYLLQVKPEGEQMKLNWREPVDTEAYRHDNGTHGGRLGTAESTAKSVYGSVFRTPAKLTGMTWFTENYLMTHPTVNVFVFDLDDNGEPTSTLLYSAMNVSNTDLQWVTYEFPEPVLAPRGYMLALSYEGHVGLGLDTGEGPDYPFAEHVNCYAKDYTTGQFTYTEEHDIRRSLMIRGIGMEYGIDELPSAVSSRGYQVWRLQQGQEQQPESWVSLTSAPLQELDYVDAAWKTLSQGFYLYAVKAVYDNGNKASLPSFSGVYTKDMHTQVTLVVTTNTPKNEADGVNVILTNADGDASHVYSGVTDAHGKVKFDEVWKGNYQVTFSKRGFDDLLVESVDFGKENVYEKSGFVLKEYVVSPFNLEVSANEFPQQRLFRWNVSDAIFDDFESHPDFAINSAGTVGWNFIDADGKETYAIDGVNYPNAEKPMAYMVFNPSETDPDIAFSNPGIRAYSGKKYLASFPARGSANNDFIISPKLKFNTDFTLRFFAKGFTDDYGLELMNVGYSTTGDAASDFVWLNGENPIEVSAKAWAEYTDTIPAAATYVAINCVSYNVFMLMLDDIFVGISLPEGVEIDRMREDLSFEVYLDGEKVTTTNDLSYCFKDLNKGKHRAGVKAVFASETTALVETEFDVEEGNSIDCAIEKQVSVYPNPAKDVVMINGHYDKATLKNLSGQTLAHYAYGDVISVSALPEGIYLLCVEVDGTIIVVKLSVTK